MHISARQAALRIICTLVSLTLYTMSIFCRAIGLPARAFVIEHFAITSNCKGCLDFGPIAKFFGTRADDTASVRERKFRTIGNNSATPGSSV